MAAAVASAFAAPAPAPAAEPMTDGSGPLLPVVTDPLRFLSIYIHSWKQQPLTTIAFATHAIQFELCRDLVSLPTKTDFSLIFSHISSQSTKGQISTPQIHKERRDLVISHTLHLASKNGCRRIYVGFVNGERKQQIICAELKQVIDRDTPGVTIQCSPTKAGLIFTLP